VKLRLRSPRHLARLLLAQARRRPEEVEEFLDTHGEAWEALAEAAPGAAADILEELSDEAMTELLSDLEPAEAADVLVEMQPELAVGMLEDYTVEAAAGLLAEMDPEDAADLLGEFEDDTAVSLLDLMDQEAADEVRRLLLYPPDSAGGLMTTDIAALPLGLSAGEAIERIRSLHEELEDLSYVYVVDDNRALKGVVSFRDLVFNRPGVGLDEVMVPDVLTVEANTDREEVAELIQRYHLFGLPVVDDHGRLLGMVTTDAVIEAVQEEASEDFAVAVGAGTGESVRSPIRRSIRSRLPWIAFDVVISSAVVIAVSQFSPILDAFVVLAALMPLVARIGGDSGAQSLAVVIRGLALDDIPIQGSTGRILVRETAIGAINGLFIGFLSGALGFVMQSVNGGPDPARVGLAMALAAWANLVIAGLAGSGIPLLLRRMGVDPALGSNLFLTTITDLLGFAGFLAVATALLT
jgi:magnesium transporter